MRPVGELVRYRHAHSRPVHKWADKLCLFLLKLLIGDARENINARNAEGYL